MKKLVYIFLFLVVLIVPLFSTTNRTTPVYYQPNVMISANLYNTFGINEAGKDEIGDVTRSQAMAEADLGIFSVKIKDTEVHVGFLAAYGTKSMLYAGRYMYSFTSLGFTLGATYHFSYHWATGALLAVRFPIFAASDIQTASVGISLMPEYIFSSTIRNNYSLIVPLHLDYKKNYLSYSIGIGIKWTYNKLVKAPLWLIQQQEASNSSQKYYIH